MASFDIHLAGALAPLVTLTGARMAGGRVGASRVAVATLAVGEVVVAWSAVVAVLALEAFEALALARAFIAVGTQ